MAVTTPEWLQRRAGQVRESTLADIWLVMLKGEPQYRLIPVPAQSKYACDIIETASGKKLGDGQIYATSEEAVRGGLERLRTVLGW
jgi:hypothetical protein